MLFFTVNNLMKRGENSRHISILFLYDDTGTYDQTWSLYLLQFYLNQVQ